MNKKMFLMDNAKSTDNATIKHTEVIITEMGSGRPIFKSRGSNKVIISGSEVNANKLFNFGTGDAFMSGAKVNDVYTSYCSRITNYDKALADNGKALAFPSDLQPIGPDNGFSIEESRKIYLFAVGIDGCGIEDSRKFMVKKDKWIAPYGPLRTADTNEVDPGVTTCLIPFRYQQCQKSGDVLVNDLSADERQMYFGRSVIDETNVAYFFKTFDTPPEIIQRYTDNTSLYDLDGDVWKTDKTVDPEVCVKLKMTVSKTDVRDWFDNNAGQGNARVNTISLCSAIPYKSESDGFVYYKDIRPITKYNFNNESLIDSSKALEITYLLYF